MEGQVPMTDARTELKSQTVKLSGILGSLSQGTAARSRPANAPKLLIKQDPVA